MVNGGENIKNSDENYRMKYPLDVLNKRQFGYLGDIAHKYYNFQENMILHVLMNILV